MLHFEDLGFRVDGLGYSTELGPWKWRCKGLCRDILGFEFRIQEFSNTSILGSFVKVLAV